MLARDLPSGNTFTILLLPTADANSLITFTVACAASPNTGTLPINANSGLPSATSNASPTPGTKLDATFKILITGPPGLVFSQVIVGETIFLSYQLE